MPARSRREAGEEIAGDHEGVRELGRQAEALGGASPEAPLEVVGGVRGHELDDVLGGLGAQGVVVDRVGHPHAARLGLAGEGHELGSHAAAHEGEGVGQGEERAPLLGAELVHKEVRCERALGAPEPLGHVVAKVAERGGVPHSRS